MESTAAARCGNSLQNSAEAAIAVSSNTMGSIGWRLAQRGVHQVVKKRKSNRKGRQRKGVRIAPEKENGHASKAPTEVRKLPKGCRESRASRFQGIFSAAPAIHPEVHKALGGKLQLHARMRRDELKGFPFLFIHESRLSHSQVSQDLAVIGNGRRQSPAPFVVVFVVATYSSKPKLERNE